MYKNIRESDINMKAKNILILICILIFLTGLIGSLWIIFKPHSQTVQIIQDGNVLYTIDLYKSEDKIIEVDYNGSKNIIQIQDHQICVKDAECPDKVCVNMGKLNSGTAPIVCLPNKLIIQFIKTEEFDAEVK